MAEVEMPHSGHDRHLCWLTNMGYHRSKFEEYKKLVRGGKYICQGCGRVATDKDNLCDPIEL
jgi:hypothetical protein